MARTKATTDEPAALPYKDLKNSKRVIPKA